MDNLVRIAIRIPEDLREELQAQADKDPANPGNLNAMIRKALSEWLEGKKRKI